MNTQELIQQAEFIEERIKLIKEELAVPYTEVECGAYVARFHKSLKNRGMYTPGTQNRIADWMLEAMIIAIRGGE